jgi:hypothetical protein
MNHAFLLRQIAADKALLALAWHLQLKLGEARSRLRTVERLNAEREASAASEKTVSQLVIRLGSDAGLLKSLAAHMRLVLPPQALSPPAARSAVKSPAAATAAASPLALLSGNEELLLEIELLKTTSAGLQCQVQEITQLIGADRRHLDAGLTQLNAALDRQEQQQQASSNSDINSSSSDGLGSLSTSVLECVDLIRCELQQEIRNGLVQARQLMQLQTNASATAAAAAAASTASPTASAAAATASLVARGFLQPKHLDSLQLHALSRTKSSCSREVSPCASGGASSSRSLTPRPLRSDSSSSSSNSNSNSNSGAFDAVATAAKAAVAVVGSERSGSASSKLRHSRQHSTAAAAAGTAGATASASHASGSSTTDKGGGGGTASGDAPRGRQRDLSPLSHFSTWFKANSSSTNSSNTSAAQKCRASPRMQATPRSKSPPVCSTSTMAIGAALLLQQQQQQQLLLQGGSREGVSPVAGGYLSPCF